MFELWNLFSFFFARRDGGLLRRKMSYIWVDGAETVLYEAPYHERRKNQHKAFLLLRNYEKKPNNSRNMPYRTAKKKNKFFRTKSRKKSGYLLGSFGHSADLLSSNHHAWF